MPSSRTKDDMSLGQMMRRRFGDEIVEVIAAPLLAGIHAGNIDRLSLRATMPALKRLQEDYRSLILGAMASKNKARQKAASSTAVKAKPQRSMFINLKGGLIALIERLAQEIENGTTILTNTKVLDVRWEASLFNVLVEGAGEKRTLQADAVVVAAPANLAGQVLSHLSMDLNRLREIRYASTATVVLGYEGNPLPKGFSASGFLIPSREGTAITACTVVSTKWSHSNWQGHTLLRCYVGRDGDEEAVGWDDETIVDAVIRDLRRVDVMARPVYSLVTKWYQAMPQFDVGHLERVAAIEALEAQQSGLALAGAAYRGMGIPDCIVDGTRAATKVMDYLKAQM